MRGALLRGPLPVPAAEPARPPVVPAAVPGTREPGHAFSGLAAARRTAPAGPSSRAARAGSPPAGTAPADVAAAVLPPREHY